MQVIKGLVLFQKAEAGIVSRMNFLFRTLFIVGLLLVAGHSTALCWEGTVLVIPKSERVEYWQWVKQGAVKAGLERNVRVVWRGPLSSMDYEAQLRIIQLGIEDGVNAIVIAPNHMTKGAPLLEEARSKGIKIVIIDSDMLFQDRVSFVGTDNLQAGRVAARHLLSLAGPKDKFLLLRHLPENESTLERERGFLSQVKEAASGHSVLDGGFLGTSKGEAYHRSMTLLQEHPDIRGIFCSGETATLGCIQAVEELGLADRIKVIGFDYTEQIHDALAKGTLHSIILQRPFQIGYLGVMAACDALDGRPVEKRIVTSTSVVTDVDVLRPLEQ